MNTLVQALIESAPEQPRDEIHALLQFQSRTALVTGAGSGIGLALVDQLLLDPDIGCVFAGCRKPEYSVALRERAAENPQLQIIELDVTDASSVENAAKRMQAAEKLDLVINTAGILHSVGGMRPEKRLTDINTDDLMLAFDVNALGALRLAVELEPLLRASKAGQFISLSARVGSISDNNLGGWYAYRASKAALNMLLRTLSIEWSRGGRPITCAALHPGTVSTALSDPFTGDNYKGTVFTPAEAATHMLSVIDGLTQDDSGGFYAWDGQEIPW